MLGSFILGGVSLESECRKLSLPLRRVRLVLRSGGDWIISSGGSTRASLSESRDPFIGVGMMLMRLLGIGSEFLGDIGRLLADCSSASSASSESASAILNSPVVVWPL